MTSVSLGQIVYSFIEDHLKTQKGLSPLSIKSYRDTLRLFLIFTARNAGCRIARLSLELITFERVAGFLRHLEGERRNQIRTRNQRLAALHSFFEYLASRVPEMMAVAERVAAIPTKRAPLNETRFLDRDEIGALFAQLPAKGSNTKRDPAPCCSFFTTLARACRKWPTSGSPISNSLRSRAFISMARVTSGEAAPSGRRPPVNCEH